MKAPNFHALLDKLRFRKRGYQQIFADGAPGRAALADLSRFCRAFENEIVIGDHDRTLILAGRREAFMRIVQHLKLEPNELIDLYASNKREGTEQ